MQVAKSEGEACRGKEEDTLESSGNVAVIIIIDGVAYSCLYVHHDGVEWKVTAQRHVIVSLERAHVIGVA
jgi:hypothetical protein